MWRTVHIRAEFPRGLNHGTGARILTAQAVHRRYPWLSEGCGLQVRLFKRARQSTTSTSPQPACQHGIVRAHLWSMPNSTGAYPTRQKGTLQYATHGQSPGGSQTGVDDAQAITNAESAESLASEGDATDGGAASGPGIDSSSGPAEQGVMRNVSTLEQVANDTRNMLRSMVGVGQAVQSYDTAEAGGGTVPRERRALNNLLHVRNEVIGVQSALTSTDEERRGRLQQALHNLDAAIESVRSQPALQHLAEAFGSWEERLDVHAGPSLRSVVGQYSFNDMQLETFRTLNTKMRAAAFGLFAVTLAIWVNTVITLTTLHGTVKVRSGITLGGICLSSYTAVANSLVFGWLIWMGAVSFKGVTTVETEGQLSYAMQGIIQLGIIFMQMGPMTLCFSIVNIIEAAMRWPGIMPLTAVLTTAFVLLRGAALFTLLGKYRPGSLAAAQGLLAMHDGVDSQMAVSPVERLALNIVAGGIQPYSPLPPPAIINMEETIDLSDHIAQLEGTPGTAASEYEFTRWEERILEVVMDSMRAAGIMAAIQAISTALLGVSVLMQGNYYGAYCAVMVDLIEQSWRAAILIASAGCFQKVLTTEGHDISNLLEGLGTERGIAKLFDRFQKVLWTSAFWRSVDISIRLLVSTALFQQLCNKLGPMITGFIARNYSQIRFLLATVGLS